VEVEMSIQQKLQKFPIPDFVWEEYHMDQRINDRGIALDWQVVENAIQIDAISKEEMLSAMKEITKLENPNSVLQMREWLLERGVETDSLDKKAVATMMKDADAELYEVLSLRQQIAKSSIKKYQVMENVVCNDGRVHGMFQFYGANRSGRWAGRLIQLQNLPQNHMPDLEEWRTEVFRNNGDIYCASASAMFGVPVEKHGVNSHLRQQGKIAELALGYGGSVGDLKSMVHWIWG